MVAGAGAGGSRVAIGTPVPGESSSSAGGVSIGHATARRWRRQHVRAPGTEALAGGGYSCVSGDGLWKQRSPRAGSRVASQHAAPPDPAVPRPPAPAAQLRDSQRHTAPLPSVCLDKGQCCAPKKHTVCVWGGDAPALCTETDTVAPSSA